MTDIKNIYVGDWVVVVPMPQNIRGGLFVRQVYAVNTDYILPVGSARVYHQPEIYGSFASKADAEARLKEVKPRLEAHYNEVAALTAKLKRWRDALDCEDDNG